MRAIECKNEDCPFLDKVYTSGEKCGVSISPSGLNGLQEFCPKKLGWTIETLRKACDSHMDGDLENDPEATKEGWCLAHLNEGLVPRCKLAAFANLAYDPDYEITKESLQRIGNP
jgi:hypothetical protein